MGRLLVRIAVFAGLGGFLHGYDLALIGGALLGIRSELGIHDTAALEAIVGGAKLGAVFGTFFGAAAMLRYGRRISIALSSGFFTVGPIIMALSGGTPSLVVGRFCVGLGIGSSAIVVPAYLAELAPAAIRGAIVQVYEVMLCIGMLAASFVDLILLAHGGKHGWRWMVGVPMLPGALMAAALFLLPESPRWLVSRQRFDEAMEVLTRVLGSSVNQVVGADHMLTAAKGSARTAHGLRSLSTRGTKEDACELSNAFDSAGSGGESRRHSHSLPQAEDELLLLWDAVEKDKHAIMERRQSNPGWKWQPKGWQPLAVTDGSPLMSTLQDNSASFETSNSQVNSTDKKQICNKQGDAQKEHQQQHLQHQQRCQQHQRQVNPAPSNGHRHARVPLSEEEKLAQCVDEEQGEGAGVPLMQWQQQQYQEEEVEDLAQQCRLQHTQLLQLHRSVDHSTGHSIAQHTDGSSRALEMHPHSNAPGSKSTAKALQDSMRSDGEPSSQQQQEQASSDGQADSDARPLLSQVSGVTGVCTAVAHQHQASNAKLQQSTPGSPPAPAQHTMPGEERTFLHTLWFMLCDIVAVARGPERRALYMCLCLAFLNQACASTAIINYAPTLLHDMVGTEDQGALLLSTLLGVTKVMGVFAALLMVDRVGRRPLLMWGGTGCMVSLALATVAVETGHPTLLIGAMCLFILAFGVSSAGIYWILVSEVFSMTTKSPASAAATAFLFLSGSATNMVFLSVVDKIGAFGFLPFGGVAAAQVVYVWWAVPETRGRSLTQIQALFE